MSNFNKNKASRMATLANLREQMQASASGKGQQRSDDGRYWKLEVDKTGTGSAVIRFLPGKESDPFPYATLHTHGFQGPSGKWFIENCPTSISAECPSCKHNSELWNSGKEEDKTTARNRKRKLNYISNILVIKDPKHPENEGKVFLYKYGKKIFEKIKDLLMPPEQFSDMDPVNAFDPYEGANFKLRVTKVDGYPNYDKSAFDTPTALFSGDDDKIAALEGQLYSLEEVVGKDQFKSITELETRLNAVLGNTTSDGSQKTSSRRPVAADDEDEVVAPAARPTNKPTPAPTAKASKAPVVLKDEDDDDDFFAKLAQDNE